MKKKADNDKLKSITGGKIVKYFNFKELVERPDIKYIYYRCNKCGYSRKRKPHPISWRCMPDLKEEICPDCGSFLHTEYEFEQN